MCYTLHMKHSDWKALSEEERKTLGWHRHPHIRTATIYAIVFAIAFIVVILGISKNSTVHLNRKPTAREAFETAKVFVKDKLKQPTTANFPENSYKPVIDTATNSYQLQSVIKFITTSGKTIKSNWIIKMHYIKGDWSEKTSWQVESITMDPEDK